jgi:uncharacterized membrane protein YecN with MAPEG domain
MMKMPVISGFYLAILALLYVALSVRVIGYRRKVGAAFGDKEDPGLRSAIRAHAHFAEYVPLAMLMIMVVEMGQAAPLVVHGLCLLLVVARLAHPVGMYAKPGTPRFQGRVIGQALTMTTIILAALLLLWRAVAG